MFDAAHAVFTSESKYIEIKIEYAINLRESIKDVVRAAASAAHDRHTCPF